MYLGSTHVYMETVMGQVKFIFVFINKRLGDITQWVL